MARSGIVGKALHVNRGWRIILNVLADSDTAKLVTSYPHWLAVYRRHADGSVKLSDMAIAATQGELASWLCGFTAHNDDELIATGCGLIGNVNTLALVTPYGEPAAARYLHVVSGLMIELIETYQFCLDQQKLISIASHSE